MTEPPDLAALGVEDQRLVATPELPNSATSGRGYWAGGCKGCYDGDRQAVVIAYRLSAPADGHTLVFAESHDDGLTFSEVTRLDELVLGVKGVGAPALRRTHGGVQCVVSHTGRSGKQSDISSLHAPTPAGLGSTPLEPVLQTGDARRQGITRPVYGVESPVWLGEALLINALTGPAGPAPTYRATSRDGRRLRALAPALALGPAGSWDHWRARITGLVDLGSKWMAFYDGAADPAQDTEETSSLLLSPDRRARTWQRSRLAPLLRSPHGLGGLRFISAVVLPGARVLLFWERTEKDESHRLWCGETTIARLQQVATDVLGT